MKLQMILLLFSFDLPPNPGQNEEINLSLYFHSSLWCLKRFCEALIKPFETPQRSVK